MFFLSKIARFFFFALFLCVVFLFLAPTAVFCVENPDYAAIFALLDSERYSLREEARQRLAACAENPAAQAGLARAIQEKLAEEGVSYEVQHILERTLKTLPVEYGKKPVNAERPVSEAEITQLAQQLQAPDPATRMFAQRKLEALADHPACALRVYEAVCGEIRDHAGTAGDENALLAVASQARQRWLVMPDTPENTPVMTETQIAGWLRRVMQPVSGAADSAETPVDETEKIPGFAPLRQLFPGQELLKTPEIAAFQKTLDPKERSRRIACWNAIRCLEDALACQKYAPVVERKLREMAGNTQLTPDAEAVMEYLRSLSAPIIAAEYWTGERLSHAQILEIGVPQKSGTMPSETFFDRMDGEMVHCEKGNSLKQGMYRIGHAIPQPGNPDAYFHLVNLSSPRRQLTYPAFMQAHPEERWTEIVLRTLTPRLERKECLHTAELVMLARIQRAAAVQLAGRFLEEVPEKETDAPREITDQIQTEFSTHFRGQKVTHHALLCYLVGKYGTKNDAPVLLAAIRKWPSLACGENQQYAMGYVAAFCLAERDPWEGVDAWLLSVLEVDQPLVHSAQRMVFSDPMVLSVPGGGGFSREKYGMTLAQQTPTAGATAAALWMKRHGMNPQDAGLTPVTDSLLEACGVKAFYGTPGANLKVLAERQKKLP